MVLRERERTRPKEKDKILAMICKELLETEISIEQALEVDVVYEVRRTQIQIIKRIIFVSFSLRQQIPAVES